MRTITLEELLEAGSHFGHQVTRHNPKSRDYVFEARDNIHIIDLAKTKEGLEEAAQFVKQLAEKGGSLIILGAKRQADAIVKEEAKRAKEEGVSDLYFVTARWIGGLLTNFPEVSKNFRKLKDLTGRLNDKYEKAKYTKKEIALWEKERQKLENFYSGVAEMTKIPEAVFIIDTHLEDLAVREARAMRVPVVGITDTNADPTIIDYPIPANDDAAGSIKLITSYIVDAWIEGKKKAAKGGGEASETTKEAKADGQSKTVAKKVEESGDKKEEKIVKESLAIDTKKDSEEVMEQKIRQPNVTKKNSAKPKATVKKK
jgi:small subunit ribosomal protein S2